MACPDVQFLTVIGFLDQAVKRGFINKIWFCKLFPVAGEFSQESLVGIKPKGFGLQPLPETPDGVLVSEPERALLEMLSEVGVYQGVDEVHVALSPK